MVVLPFVISSAAVCRQRVGMSVSTVWFGTIPAVSLRPSSSYVLVSDPDFHIGHFGGAMLVLGGCTVCHVSGHHVLVRVLI